MSQRIQGYAYLALAMILVGSTVVTSKVIAAELPPFTATALRFAIAFPLFYLIMRASGAKWPKLSSGDWFILLAQGVAGSVGYTALLITGLQLTSAGDASVIIGTLPIVSAATAVLVLGERPHRSLLLTVLLAAAGVAIIAYQPDSGGGHSIAGNLLVFGAVACESLFILLNKRLKADIPPMALSTMMTGIGLVTAVIPAMWEMRQIAAVPAGAMWAVVYYALIPTVAGYLLWYAGSARVSGTEASLFTALAPVSSLVFAAILLNEEVGWRQVAGIACVSVAVVLPLLKQRPKLTGVGSSRA